MSLLRKKHIPRMTRAIAITTRAIVQYKFVQASSTPESMDTIEIPGRRYVVKNLFIILE